MVAHLMVIPTVTGPRAGHDDFCPGPRAPGYAECSCPSPLGVFGIGVSQERM